LAILPRNIPHGFRNVGLKPSKILIMIRPGGFERFFEDVSQLPADSPTDMERVNAIARKYELELLPPSIATRGKMKREDRPKEGASLNSKVVTKNPTPAH
jgi:hypothetical protein